MTHIIVIIYCTPHFISPWSISVLEPHVLPAFAITYFCNHCNIRFENTSKYVDTLTLFSKNLNQRSLTPRWPLTPCLLRSHVWLYPRIIVSKSHDNTSMYCHGTGTQVPWQYIDVLSWDWDTSPSPMTIHQCMWIQWSILQNTSYIHILRIYYILRTE